MSEKKLSIYICYLLRHHPEAAELDMDRHGWVRTEDLIRGINRRGKYTIDLEQLQKLVANDEKGRYRFKEGYSKIKACQGHSIPWVEPELTEMEPPEVLYHGTTEKAYGKILADGYIKKMNRHAVHMQADIDKAWQSADRWHSSSVVLKIDAGRMSRDRFKFGVSDNEVWCTEAVPTDYICDAIVR